MRISVDAKAVAGLLDDFQEEAHTVFELAVLNAYLELRKATPIDTGEAQDGWEIDKPLSLDDVAKITNEVEHIVYLNQGSSEQAPAYFVEQTLVKLGFTLA